MALGAAMLVIIVGRDHLWAFFVALGVVGLGSGMVFAAAARLITRLVPADETGSALGLNQVVRQVGFSLGSAISGAILAAHTAADATLPAVDGYVVTAWVGVGVCLVAAVLGAALPNQRVAAEPNEVAESAAVPPP
jgi:MFS family permease